MATVNKPPLPSSTVWDCLRIPLQFWVEFLFGALAFMALTISLEKRIGQGAFLATMIFTFVMTLFVLVRMVRKVIALRNKKGPMRGNGLLAFWALLVLPAVALGFFYKHSGAGNPLEARQAEARNALGVLVEAEAKFKQDFGTYTLSMKELGFDPDLSVPRYYMVGFPTACALKAGLSSERAQVGVHEAPVAEARKLAISEYFLKARNPEDCKDPKEGYELYAVGVAKEGAKLDVWRVDEKGKIENVQVGE